MRRPMLAIVLIASMTGVLLLDLAAVLFLASTHRFYVGLLAGMAGTIPGYVIAGLAWRGKLPTCAR